MFWVQHTFTQSRFFKSCLRFLNRFFLVMIWTSQTSHHKKKLYFCHIRMFVSTFLHLSLFLVEVSLLITSKMCFWCIDPDGCGEWWSDSAISRWFVERFGRTPKGSVFVFNSVPKRITRSPDPPIKTGEFEPGFSRVCWFLKIAMSWGVGILSKVTFCWESWLTRSSLYGYLGEAWINLELRRGLNGGRFSFVFFVFFVKIFFLWGKKKKEQQTWWVWSLENFKIQTWGSIVFFSAGNRVYTHEVEQFAPE